MCKKIGIAAVAVLAGLLVLNNTRLGSWVGFAWKNMKEKVQNAVPPELEIERLKYELTQLEPEINKTKDELAKERVAVKELDAEIKNTRVKLERKGKAIQEAIREVNDGAQKVSYRGQEYDRLEAKKAILSDKKVYDKAVKALEARETLLSSKKTAVAKANEQLENWQTVKAELEARIDKIESDLKLVREAQKQNHINFDNSKLSQLDESLTELDRTVKVMQERIAMEQGEFLNSTTKSEKAEAIEREWRDLQDDKPAKVAADR
jgi:chromosome segregation ATPase